MAENRGGAVFIGDAMKQVLKSSPIQQHDSLREYRESYKRLFGQTKGRVAKPKGDMLMVWVDNSVQAFELSQQKFQILDEMKKDEKLKVFRDIKFVEKEI